jgi:hypothetical protein
VPAPPAVRVQQKARGRTTGVAGSSGLPCAMALRLIRALPGDEFFFATVAPRIEWRIRRPVGPSTPPQSLASATDARTTRLRRPQKHRSSCAPRFAHGSDPALRRPCARDALASTAFRPNVRDDAYAPLIGPGWREEATDRGIREANYFCARDWTTQITLKRFGKFDFWCGWFFRRCGIHATGVLSELARFARRATGGIDPHREVRSAFAS